MQTLPEIPQVQILQYLPIKDLVATCLAYENWYQTCTRPETISILSSRLEEMVGYLKENIGTLDEASLRLLLMFGVDVNLALYSAIMNNREDLVNLLLTYPFRKDDANLVGAAIVMSKPEILFQLFSVGVDSNLLSAVYSITICRQGREIRSRYETPTVAGNRC